MKRRFILVLLIFSILVLSACAPSVQPDQPETNPTVSSPPEQTEPETTEPAQPKPEVTKPAPTEEESTIPETTQPIITEPEHSDLYIPGVTVEDVILYFNEVCLDSEFINSGDPSFVQKWDSPIYYTIEGSYTDEDIAVLKSFEKLLNNLDGFPGIFPTEDPIVRNLRICFCTQQEMVSLLGSNFTYMDGGVTFWYDYNVIYDAIICCRTDLGQELRNSVILEEVYNGLGPIQDTGLREDSIIYQEFSQPQWLTSVDILILQLLYHPDILPGMDAAECEQVIRSLYY